MDTLPDLRERFFLFFKVLSPLTDIGQLQILRLQGFIPFFFFFFAPLLPFRPPGLRREFLDIQLCFQGFYSEIEIIQLVVLDIECFLQLIVFSLVQAAVVLFLDFLVHVIFFLDPEGTGVLFWLVDHHCALFF